MNQEITRVKISDIAKKAKVSAGTVDRVIHNRGEVSQATRERVLKIIKEVNYQPDIVASSLASKKSLRFSAILPQGDSDNPFWKIPVEGLQMALDEIKHFGITLEKHHFVYHDRKNFIKIFKKVLESEPDGIIVTPFFRKETRSFVEQSNQKKIPVVFLNTFIEDTNSFAFVGQDSKQSGRVAAQLLDYGLEPTKEILILNIINEKSGNAHILSREEGFRDYFHLENPGRPLRSIQVKARHVDELGKELSTCFLSSRHNPCAHGVFVTNSKVFLVADFFEKNNIRNVQLIGYDLLPSNIDHLKNGNIRFLIGQKPMDQGYKSLMTLFNALFMKKKIQQDQYLPIDIITKENLDFYLNHKK